VVVRRWLLVPLLVEEGEVGMLEVVSNGFGGVGGVDLEVGVELDGDVGVELEAWVGWLGWWPTL